jgi:hypothetical protein
LEGTLLNDEHGYGKEGNRAWRDKGIEKRGINLKLEKNLPAGRQVRFEICLPDSQPNL